MRPVLSLALLLLLAACGTPQQRCEIQATRDLRVVDELIAESEATLRRGYALREEQRTRFGTTICYGGGSGHGYGYGFCWGNDTYTSLRPVAVNLDEERAKLLSLQQKREELQAQARAQLDACARLPS